MPFVQRMPGLHNELRQVRIEATDQEIDALVYDSHGLTEEEIALVEEETK